MLLFTNYKNHTVLDRLIYAETIDIDDLVIGIVFNENVVINLGRKYCNELPNFKRVKINLFLERG